ncbi:MAG: nitrate ABC transporter ATP-binding protein [Hoeflea sp.]|uniref:ABC transporter ATP-binding protein n=1 Tax=Hoeflea sp. TaxID=1940281 RepID=UPI001DC7C227|nr:nitrate ABC transporter ATP-binding protein [Hoeflea sp.]MBU4531585.1 nitrate ABC transporter ATP-binding protein [Alphaproteobacteria bacterium]MBU4544442.1 nitrate ABC transporter ATP-binding protein [Alphaproteobacteria bacterium]MBU4550321.1 nitrate ABC transporter ATP-binding protein [Alphaproteobacteria bacterium]MBV1724861.1 nitrate ABC transporter ATP-binding protein [Hoeflea sp.]MBV1760881.1 nitrate ABC transporter ATP-binding protein [Hoeflea sp.]
MTVLEISALSKSYGEGADRTEVLSDINLKVADGEFIAIVGFSGSGKTTLISLLAGLIKPDLGGVIFRGREVDSPGPERGVVFQSYSLMPWMTVAGNVSLAVDSVFKTRSRTERAAIVDKYIDMVGLGHARDRKPAELSGGMRQRVAVARALAMQPEVLLLDEPLSALDALTRAKLQDELADICQKEKKTIILITNDVDEAILLADRIIPLKPGPNATLGPDFPVDIARPRNRAGMNSDEDFIRLRREITSYLMEVGAERGTEAERTIILPNIVPISLGRDRLPRAYVAASTAVRAESFLEFSQLKKVYPTPKGPLTVVDGFEMKMRKGEFTTLIGHSGCGKSTVLSMVAGLNPITEGAIILDGRHITQAGPDRAVVFQAPSLMPWLTAYENVALGVDRVYPNASKAERNDVVEYYLQRVGLLDSMHRPALDLSNGMKQRVGIARAFALSPKLLLLDEPFGMLDSLTRWELQDVLMDVWKRTQVTAICVTHDVDEAILLADRVVMMSNGPNARIGNIMAVDLERPRSRKALLNHPDYYAYREELLEFLSAYEGGANPSEIQLQSISEKRSARVARQKSAAARLTAAE